MRDYLVISRAQDGGEGVFVHDHDCGEDAYEHDNGREVKPVMTGECVSIPYGLCRARGGPGPDRCAGLA